MFGAVIGVVQLGLRFKYGARPTGALPLNGAGGGGTTLGVIVPVTHADLAPLGPEDDHAVEPRWGGMRSLHGARSDRCTGSRGFGRGVSILYLGQWSGEGRKTLGCR